MTDEEIVDLETKFFDEQAAIAQKKFDDRMKYLGDRLSDVFTNPSAYKNLDRG